MIGEEFRSTVAASVLGADRSPLMPAQLRLGWLDATGAVLGLAPGSVPSDVFEPSGDGVVNTALMDGGVAGPGWVVHGVGLFTLDGVLVLSQDLAAPQSPQEGDPLVFAPGAFRVEVA